MLITSRSGTERQFFYVKSIRRIYRNIIDSLLASDGPWCTTRKSLEDLLTTHFQNISNTVQSYDCIEFTRHIPFVITNEDNEDLLKIPYEEEITCTIKSM